jgi:iron complex transport system permease protein
MKVSLTKFLIIISLLLILTSIINLFTGSYPVLKGLIKGDKFSSEVLFNLRLPHILLAISSGILLSLSGAMFQSILSNPLADPYILGVSGGAASFILVSNLLKIPQGFPYSSIIGFLGATFNAFLVYFLSIKNGKINITKLLITGIILNAFYSAIILFSMALLNKLDLNRFIYWMMGDFSSKTLKEGIIFFIFTIIFSIPPLILHKGFDLISLGTETAQTSGIEVDKFLIFSYINASLLSALSVSFVGIIGFIGLIIPNIIRIFFSSEYRVLFPLSVFGGAIFLVLSDLLTRFEFFQNVPIGAISAIFGVPFFIYLLRKNGSN